MQISVIFKDRKDAGVLIGIISPWNFQVLCLQMLERAWKVTVDSHKIDQVAAVGETVNASCTRFSLGEQINTVRNPSYVATDLDLVATACNSKFWRLRSSGSPWAI